jgi:Glycosyl transferases group 1
VRILLWHVHGSWTTAFVQGDHEYLLPVDAHRGPDGRGRAQTWDWPTAAIERTPEQLRTEPFDVVILQRPDEAQLVERWTGRRPGHDVPAVYLEHDAPHPHPTDSRHPFAGGDIPIVHVTHFNRLYWDCGGTPTFLIQHGVLDPGVDYDGSLARAAVVVNHPRARRRTVGTDLYAELTAGVDLDVFGMTDGSLADVLPNATQIGNLPHAQLFPELARRRVYLHPFRWTSLGLALLEAMIIGMPVVGLAATEIGEAVPPGAGVVSTDPGRLAAALRTYVHDADAAREAGRIGRAHVRQRYNLERFLREWDVVLKEVTR